MPDFTRLVRNRSARSAEVDTIIIHTTQGHNREGVSDLVGLAGWFDNPGSQASSHLGIDQEGNCVRMVPDAEKAWTSGGWNSRSLNIELVGFAEWGNRFWRHEYRKGLNRAAKAVAEWSIKYRIPIRKRAGDGVCGHVDISGPGGHWDPGPGFPWKTFLLLARLWRLRLRRKNKKTQRRWRTIIKRWLRK